MEECCLSTTLRKLTIDGCFFHDGDGDMWLPFNGQTPLEELHLRDCNLNLPSLRRMLALPRGLKRLYLEQTDSHHEMAPSVTQPSSMKQWVQDVLKLQQHSLEHLDAKCFFPPFPDGYHNSKNITGHNNDPDVDLKAATLADFEEFEKLETIRLWDRYDYGGAADNVFVYDVRYTCKRSHDTSLTRKSQWETMRVV